MSSRNQFLLLNVLGGIAVLGSYYWGFVSYPQLRSEFWGEVPQSLKGLYTLNMFFAAAGYIAAFVYFFVRRPAERFGDLLLPHALILIPSALWLPLTVAVLQHPGTLLWWAIRVDLFAVAIGGLWVLANVWRTGAGKARVAVAGAMLFFVLQTTVLDALIWPAYFSLPTG